MFSDEVPRPRRRRREEEVGDTKKQERHERPRRRREEGERDGVAAEQDAPVRRRRQERRPEAEAPRSAGAAPAEASRKARREARAKRRLDSEEPAAPREEPEALPRRRGGARKRPHCDEGDRPPSREEETSKRRGRAKAADLDGDAKVHSRRRARPAPRAEADEESPLDEAPRRPKRSGAAVPGSRAAALQPRTARRRYDDGADQLPQRWEAGSPSPPSRVVTEEPGSLSPQGRVRLLPCSAKKSGRRRPAARDGRDSSAGPGKQLLDKRKGSVASIAARQGSDRPALSLVGREAAQAAHRTPEGSKRVVLRSRGKREDTANMPPPPPPPQKSVRPVTGVPDKKTPRSKVRGAQSKKKPRHRKSSSPPLSLPSNDEEEDEGLPPRGASRSHDEAEGQPISDDGADRPSPQGCDSELVEGYGYGYGASKQLPKDGEESEEEDSGSGSSEGEEEEESSSSPDVEVNSPAAPAEGPTASPLPEMAPEASAEAAATAAAVAQQAFAAVAVATAQAPQEASSEDESSSEDGNSSRRSLPSQPGDDAAGEDQPIAGTAPAATPASQAAPEAPAEATATPAADSEPTGAAAKALSAIPPQLSVMSAPAPPVFGTAVMDPKPAASKPAPVQRGDGSSSARSAATVPVDATASAAVATPQAVSLPTAQTPGATASNASPAPSMPAAAPEASPAAPQKEAEEASSVSEPRKRRRHGHRHHHHHHRSRRRRTEEVPLGQPAAFGAALIDTSQVGRRGGSRRRRRRRSNEKEDDVNVLKGMLSSLGEAVPASHPSAAASPMAPPPGDLSGSYPAGMPAAAGAKAAPTVEVYPLGEDGAWAWWCGPRRTNWRTPPRLELPAFDVKAAASRRTPAGPPADAKGSQALDPRGATSGATSVAQELPPWRLASEKGSRSGRKRRGELHDADRGCSFRKVRWQPLLRLALERDVAYDFSAYKGTERPRREQSRTEAAVGETAKPVPVNKTGLPAAAGSDGALAAHAAAASAAPSAGALAAASAAAVAEAGARANKGADRIAWYTQKLRALVQRLEEVVAPPDEAVRDFWAQLDSVERQRFASEFPQCMAYIPGWQKEAGILEHARK